MYLVCFLRIKREIKRSPSFPAVSFRRELACWQLESSWKKLAKKSAFGRIELDIGLRRSQRQKPPYLPTVGHSNRCAYSLSIIKTKHTFASSIGNIKGSPPNGRCLLAALFHHQSRFPWIISHYPVNDKFAGHGVFQIKQLQVRQNFGKWGDLKRAFVLAVTRYIWEIRYDVTRDRLTFY